MKVRVFRENSYDVLEAKINRWLEMNNISVHSLSSSSGESMGSVYTTVVILYDSK